MDLTINVCALPKPTPWRAFVNPQKNLLLLLWRKVVPSRADQAIRLNAGVRKEKLSKGHVDQKVGRDVQISAITLTIV